MGLRLASRFESVLRPTVFTRHISRPVRPVRVRFAATSLEPLEARQMLSVAPVAVDDAYEIGPDGKLSVDVTIPSPIPENPLPPPLAFNESRFVEPAGPFGPPEVVRLVEGGQTVTEPDWFELAEQAGTNQQVIVRDPGSRWTVSNWLDIAARGQGSISVSNGGDVVVRNFTDVGANGGSGGTGLGLVTVSGLGSTWTSQNWMEIGYRNSWGTVRLLDHAAMTINGSPPNPSSGFLVVGDNENGNGVLEVLGQSTLRHNDWLSVGDNGARGTVNVGGGGIIATANWAEIGNNRGLGTVNITGAGSRWTVQNFLTVGENGGRGVLRLADGGNAASNNWVQIGNGNGSDGRVIVGAGSSFGYREYITIGQSLARTAGGTLYVAEGGKVLASAGGQGFGNGPEILNASGGRILGGGSIQGKVTNGGLLSPGGSIGVLTIDGSLLQPAATASTPLGTGVNGTLQFDIGGTARGTGYDGLNVSGAANIAGGKVVLNFVNGFAPHAGDRFTLVDASSATSAPASVEVRGLAPGFQYTLGVENGDVVLVATSDGTSAPQAVQRKGVLANDSDPDGDALTAILVKRPEHGTLAFFSDGSFSYTVGAGFTGDDSFQYKADDGVFESNVATVRLHQDQPAPPNAAPVAADDAYATDEDTRLTVSAFDGVLKNDTDDGLPNPPAKLTASLVTGPSRGTLALNADGSFVYTPNANFFGIDSFTYRASDGSVDSAPAKVTLTVRPVNDAPVANPDSKSARQGVALTFSASDLAANDTDVDRGDTLTVTGVTATDATHGAVTLDNGLVTYTPDKKYTGPATFTYTVSDGHGGTATGMVNVVVTPRRTGTAGTAAGRGSLNGRRQTFAFTLVARAIGRDGDLSVMGMLGFEDRMANVLLRSTDVTRFDINANGKTVTIAGTAVVNGRAGYSFEVTAEDRSASGSNDRFRIRITGPEGSNFRYDSNAGSGSSDWIDRGGNITIFGSKRRDE